MGLDMEMGRHSDGEMLGYEVCNHRHSRWQSFYFHVIIESVSFDSYFWSLRISPPFLFSQLGSY